MWNLSLDVDPIAVTQKVVAGLRDGTSVAQIDELAAETAAYMSVQHPDYSKLAASVAVSNLHKQTCKSFSQVVQALYSNVNVHGCHAPIVSEELHRVVAEHAAEIDAAIIYDRDYDYDYFGFKTLERAYLLRMGGAVRERIQHMFMRVALGIHGRDLRLALETYSMMSQRKFVHATPTMFNAGTPQAQMSSCFLVDMQADSIEGIYATLGQCAQISKGAGGIGISVSKVRARGSRINGSGGTSNGLVPMLQVFNATARYVDQEEGSARAPLRRTSSRGTQM